MAGVTLRDIAGICALDTSTVSRALRDDPSVSVATRERVRAAAERLGYRPNLAARTLAGGRSRAVWLVVSSLGSPVDWHLVRAATPSAAARQHSLLVAMHDGHEELYRRIVAQFGQGSADGAVVIPRRNADDVELLREPVLRGFPIVFLDNQVEELPAPVVTTDNEGTARELVARCAQAGATTFVVTFGALPNPVERARLAGALAAIRERDLAHVVDRGGQPWRLGRGRRPVALIGTDQTALLELARSHADELRRRRLVIGCFDQWLGEPSPAERVVVAEQDGEALGRLAVERLLATIDGRAGDEPRVTVVPARSYRTVDPSF